MTWSAVGSSRLVNWNYCIVRIAAAVTIMGRSEARRAMSNKDRRIISSGA